MPSRKGETPEVKVAVTGTHGLIARHLLPALRQAGHDVVPVVRDGQPGAVSGVKASVGEVSWDPSAGTIERDALDGVEAVIHLAGVGIFHRWTAKHKAAVHDSRMAGTSLIARTIAKLDPLPKVMLSASAIGYYGDRGDEVLDESSPTGRGFLAEVCQDWEAAAAPATEAGIRTVFLRTGIVLAADGGSLAAQLPLYRVGLGGRLGSGKQWTSWISIDDEVGAILHALHTDDLSGPVNLTAPEPVTNAAFTKALASTLRRPAVFSVPGAALRLVLGSQMADEMLLGGQRVLPRALEQSGYNFSHPDVAGALASALGRE